MPSIIVGRDNVSANVYSVPEVDSGAGCEVSQFHSPVSMLASGANLAGRSMGKIVTSEFTYRLLLAGGASAANPNVLQLVKFRGGEEVERRIINYNNSIPPELTRNFRSYTLLIDGLNRVWIVAFDVALAQPIVFYTPTPLDFANWAYFGVGDPVPNYLQTNHAQRRKMSASIDNGGNIAVVAIDELTAQLYFNVFDSSSPAAQTPWTAVPGMNFTSLDIHAVENGVHMEMSHDGNIHVALSGRNLSSGYKNVVYQESRDGGATWLASPKVFDIGVRSSNVVGDTCLAVKPDGQVGMVLVISDVPGPGAPTYNTIQMIYEQIPANPDSFASHIMTYPVIEPAPDPPLQQGLFSLVFGRIPSIAVSERGKFVICLAGNSNSSPGVYFPAWHPFLFRESSSSPFALEEVPIAKWRVVPSMFFFKDYVSIRWGAADSMRQGMWMGDVPEATAEGGTYIRPTEMRC